MPGRTVVFGAQYRFGFNGKENDNEVKGPGNQQDYGMRIYDTRIGRFLSVDPLFKAFVWNSPYAYAENEPISNIDMDGLEKVKATVGGAIAAGIEKYSSEKKHQANSLFAALGSRNTYKEIWDYVKDIGKTAVGDKQSIQRFNDKTITAINNVSISLANGVSEPAVFLSSMHTRSRSENIAEGTYYALKGLEIYGSVRFFEIFENRSFKMEGIRQADRRFNHFTNVEGVSGITGINTKALNNLKIGESITVNELRFGTGKNPFMANAPGDIFVTDLGINTSKSELMSKAGVFGDKQKFVISFSEKEAFEQGVKVSGSDPSKGIYTIPANTTLKGTFKITRVRE